MEQLQKMAELLGIPNDLVEYINNIADIDLSSAEIDNYIKTVYKNKETLCKFAMVIDQYDRQHPIFVKVLKLHARAIVQSPYYASIVNKLIGEDPQIQQQFKKLQSMWNNHKTIQGQQVNLLV